MTTSKFSEALEPFDMATLAAKLFESFGGKEEFFRRHDERLCGVQQALGPQCIRHR